MTWITVEIDTVSSVAVVSYRQPDSRENLNQYERDDMTSRWVGENTGAQRAPNDNTGYLLSWKSE